MADESKTSVSELVREIKGLTIDFKKSLNPPANPWDQEVEFQRQNLRRHILQVMFKYPSSVHADKLETTLWIDTSHAVITRYRDLISKLDNKVNKSPSADQRRGNGRFGRGEEGPVALRKLMTRFRSFLSAEENFWSDLVLRLARTFDLTAAAKAISALSLSATDPAELASSKKAAGSRGSLVLSDSPVPEDVPEEIKDKKLLFLQKSLISLGDLARYREQYNEGGGRSRQGHEAQAARGNKKGGPPNLQVPRPRNYTKASECYRQAKLLLPDEVMHYYRALCVKRAFPTSRENLHKTLQKVYDAYRKTSEVLGDPVETLQHDVLVLHALWQLKPSSSKISELSANVMSSFSTLISSRSLSPDLITRILTMSLGALWTLKFANPAPPQPSVDSNSPDTKVSMETMIVAHILSLLRALSKIGISQVKEAMSTVKRDHANGIVDSLAIYITATFRRTLPALHIGSTWLKSNVEYLQYRDHSTGGNGEDSLRQFWSSYSSFIWHISRVFPLEKLPDRAVVLEEDVEFRGFMPLESTLWKEGMPNPNNIADECAVHPNEEHLMRIRTMLLDARYLASFDETPLIYSEEKFRVRSVSLADISVEPGSEYVEEDFVLPAKQNDNFAFASREEDVEDDTATVSTDDPVGLAMEATLGENDDDEDEMEDERILYPQRTSISPPMTLPQATTAFPPPLSTAGSPSRIAKPVTTAEDLLSRVLEGGIPGVQTRSRTSSDPLRAFSSSMPSSSPVPTSPLISLSFASSTPTMPPRSIWERSTPPLQSNRAGWHGNAASPLVRNVPLQMQETNPSPLSSSVPWGPRHLQQQSLSNFSVPQPPPQFIVPSGNMYNQTSAYTVGVPVKASSPQNTPFGPVGDVSTRLSQSQSPPYPYQPPNQIPFTDRDMVGSGTSSSAVVTGGYGSPAFAVHDSSSWR